MNNRSFRWVVWSLALGLPGLLLPGSAADRWALVIGVDKCQAIGELKVCAADARGMRAVLEKVGYAGHVTVLADDGSDLATWPTKSNVERAIKRLAGVADPGDTILTILLWPRCNP